MTDTVKQHHFLVAGRILFMDEQENAANVDVNCLAIGSKKTIGVKQIAGMQQSLQVNLFNRLGGPVKILNVTIISINYLGAMSDEEFNNASPADLGQDPATIN